MSTFTIGILGGMGPRATVYFEQKLLDKLEGPDQSLPRIVVVNDGTIPDRTAFLCSGGSDPLPTLRQNVRALSLLGANIVCMPCNTAHADRILGRLQAELSLPIVDMPSAAIQQATLQGHRHMLVLGTSGTKASGVYTCRANGATIMYPALLTQAKVDKLILDTKACGYVERNRDALMAIVNDSVCDAVILACTELSMLNKGLATSKPVVDALEALADECIKHVPAACVITEQ
jgi:aspartate racemase